MEWLSYEDLRIQLAIYGSCMELNFQVKRSPVSQPLAQTVLYIGTSLALPTSRGTNQHLIALQESKTLVDQGTEKGFPWICLWPVPITSLLELSERWISAVCLRSRFFFFFHRHSIDPQICSSWNVLTGRYKCVRKTRAPWMYPYCSEDY